MRLMGRSCQPGRAVTESGRISAMVTEGMLTEGSPAPPFELSDQHGSRVSLADLAGKWVVLWWYPKASTPG